VMSNANDRKSFTFPKRDSGGSLDSASRPNAMEANRHGAAPILLYGCTGIGFYPYDVRCVCATRPVLVSGDGYNPVRSDACCPMVASLSAMEVQKGI